MPNEIGKLIKARREEMHFTQAELAQKSKISRQSISLLENGKCEDVLVGTLVAIADALDTTVDTFLCPNRPNYWTVPDPLEFLTGNK